MRDLIKTLETACKAALKQMKEKDYRSELEAAGVRGIIEVGIAFKGKETRVEKG